MTYIVFGGTISLTQSINHQTLVAKENTDTHRYTLYIQTYKYTDTNTRIPRWWQLDYMTSQIYYFIN